MEIVQTGTGTWIQCVGMFGARFAVFVRRARVLLTPCHATRSFCSQFVIGFCIHFLYMYTTTTYYKSRLLSRNQLQILHHVFGLRQRTQTQP